jgi:DNA-binding winged helix-turn-helix (wHTH) protein
LGGRALDILIALTATPNEVVSKKDLMSRVWPGVVVEEGSLRFHVTGLRKALDDGRDGARYITTLSGRGYCFVGPVSRAGHSSEAASAASASFPHSYLPARLGRMVGRDADVLKLSTELLASRFITLIEEAIRTAEASGELLQIPELLRVKGNVLLSMWQPRYEDAETCLMQSLEWSRRSGALAWELRTATDLAALWADQGRAANARALLQTIFERFTEGLETGDLNSREATVDDVRLVPS